MNERTKLPPITPADVEPSRLLLAELETRIATQRLHYRAGDEETAAKSLHDLFPKTRDGKLVVAASGDKTACVWPIVAPREIVNLAHPAPVTQATFRPVIDAQGYTFITTAASGEVRSVRLTDFTPRAGEQPRAAAGDKILEPRHPGSANSAIWSADGRWLATVGGGEVIVWEWAVDAPAARVRIVNLNAAVSRAEFSPDARLLVTYGGDHLAHVWDLTKLPGGPL